MRYQNNNLGGACSGLWEDLSEVRKHLLNIQKELLLTVKAVVDVVLEKTEPHVTPSKARKVTIK